MSSADAVVSFCGYAAIGDTTFSSASFTRSMYGTRMLVFLQVSCSVSRSGLRASNTSSGFLADPTGARSSQARRSTRYAAGLYMERHCSQSQRSNDPKRSVHWGNVVIALPHSGTAREPTALKAVPYLARSISESEEE